jgi:hypothetical protein
MGVACQRVLVAENPSGRSHAAGRRQAAASAFPVIPDNPSAIERRAGHSWALRLPALVATL